MLNWPLDMGKDKVRLRSGSRTTPETGWSTVWLGSGNSRSSIVLRKGKQCHLMSR
jgi:hypothetical protein